MKGFVRSGTNPTCCSRICDPQKFDDLLVCVLRLGLLLGTYRGNFYVSEKKKEF
jgi:hypothetical protein